MTKGSIRLHLSFEPDAARKLVDLRDSGQLNRIGGFLVSNVVDLGQVEISTQALEHAGVLESPSGPSIELRRAPSDVTDGECVDALRACAWDLKAAADRLRIPLPSLYDLIERSPHIRTVGDVSGRGFALDALADAAPFLARIAQRMCGNTPDAHELLQDTIKCAIYQGLPAEVRNPHAWLATIMHSLFLDRCRAASRASVHDLLEAGHDPIGDHDNVTLSGWLLRLAGRTKP